MIALDILFGFATAASFTLGLIPLMLKLAVAYGLYDSPDVVSVSSHAPSYKAGEPRKLHSAPTPRLGGVAIVASFFITHLVWSYATPLKGPLIASFFIFLMGLYDDLYTLPARFRLVGQVILASVAVYWGGIALQEVALTPNIYFNLPFPVGFILSVFIIVGAVNAINMIDGLDGLAGGVVLIGISLLSFVYFVRMQDPNLLLYLTIPLMGSILGFLRYNTYPASIFMGDSGSNWLGFMTGVLILIILSNQSLNGLHEHQIILRPPPYIRGAQHIPLFSAVMCLAIPVFDTACVMISRMREGISPMAPDRRHFHHTLLKLGLSHSQSVSAMYFLALGSGVLGILPVIFNQYNFFWVPYIVALFLVLIIPMSINLNKSTIERLINHRIFLRHHDTWGVKVNAWIRYWENLNRYLLYLILLAAPAFAGALKPSVGYAAITAGFLLLIVSLSKKGQSDFFDSIGISLAAIVLLVANNSNTMSIEFMGERVSIQALYNGLFVFLLISTILLLAVTIKKRYFLFTPSDFLLLAIPLLIMLVPEPYKTEYRLDIICLRSLVVFLTLRTIVKRRRQASYHIKIVTFVSLAFVFLTGVFAMRIVY